MSAHELAVRHEVVVGLDQESAFELFTAHIGRWWPMATHSVFGAGGSVAFEGDGGAGTAWTRVVERHPDRPPATWAEVVEWEAPDRLRLAWHAGTLQEEATDLLVVFGAEGTMTRVALEQTAWERPHDRDQALATYEEEWPEVMSHFVEAAVPA
ncbi:MAG TPA: hypothetical protein VFJ22_04705 [Dermatophilaceae bacterium]|jgi:hypothetical protein|nr:hypothetical protein [Dermatophilaceae bacterium]